MTLNDLSPRQREVAVLIALDLSYREIATRLAKRGGGHPSVRTVEMHCRVVAGLIGDSDTPPRLRVRRWVESQRAAA